jgi:hypothetical protein
MKFDFVINEVANTGQRNRLRFGLFDATSLTTSDSNTIPGPPDPYPGYVADIPYLYQGLFYTLPGIMEETGQHLQLGDGLDIDYVPGQVGTGPFGYEMIGGIPHRFTLRATRNGTGAVELFWLLQYIQVQPSNLIFQYQVTATDSLAPFTSFNTIGLATSGISVTLQGLPIDYSITGVTVTTNAPIIPEPSALMLVALGASVFFNRKGTSRDRAGKPRFWEARKRR